MEETRPLLHGQITLQSAIEDDGNVLLELSYPENRIQFYTYLLLHRNEIESIVSFHLGLSGKQSCRLGEVKEWLSGSFNVCIPVYVGNWKEDTPRVLIRFPLPYKENCRSIPLPHLWGFGFADGVSLTAIETAPLISRLMWRFRWFVSSFLRKPLACRYFPYGAMLSETWDELRHDETRRNNLFRGLSRIILSTTQCRFDRVGSLTINNQGFIRLTNRPLALCLQHLENESIPTNIGREITYAATDAYLSDLLECHNLRVRHAPNSIRDEFYGQAQLSALTIMRAILPHFTRRDLGHGPYVLSLTDLHQSNLFVDDDWNIKYLVDLEWTCSQPVEMLQPPYWLTSRGVDQLQKGEHLNAFSNMHTEFTDTLEDEEQLSLSNDPKVFDIATLMRKGWELGSFWYFHALENPKGLCNIFLDHIQRIFAQLDDQGMIQFERTVAPYWTKDLSGFLAQKKKDKDLHDNQLWDTFLAARNRNSGRDFTFRY
ncbi:uncharacterized protein BJX67DRAFT_392056 [Aspergillus lucknowensis]|uniref:Aminoglycoside phosphotransferase domain-containing protein n=1 Tax=Aspergillus lucknowensis TaxID=176173 RepID=A0ABR4LYA3_9EURO